MSDPGRGIPPLFIPGEGVVRFSARVVGWNKSHFSDNHPLYIEGEPLLEVEIGGVQSVKLGAAALGFALGLADGDERLLTFVLRYLSIGVTFDVEYEAKDLGIPRVTARRWLEKIEKRLPEAAKKSQTLGVVRTDWVQPDPD